MPRQYKSDPFYASTSKRRKKKITEDDPRWNWKTMGNKQRGRNNNGPGRNWKK